MLMPVGWVEEMLVEIRAGRSLLNRNGSPNGRRTLMLSPCRFCGSPPTIMEWRDYYFIECMHLAGKAGTCVSGTTKEAAATNWNTMQSN